ncbi:hypothetical protein [Bacteroides sp.]|uniref:hypothetical protein n=1 Tax=Bacteroides sp. TaxID=29523 RepID=UPI0026268FDB|nr:hypothetical protein [Bacteroides sp.]
MMKSDIEIKDDIYKVIKGSALEKAVTGKLKKTKRPSNSDKEDIVISILDNGSGQIQEAFVNVNIYVPDDMRDGQAEEQSIRLRELCKLSYELLFNCRSNGFRVDSSGSKQRVLEVNGKDEHFINNKLLYKQSNE